MAIAESTSMIDQALRIPEYSIILPTSWEVHDMSRIFLYARSDLQTKVIKPITNMDDLPVISMEVSRGRQKKTISPHIIVNSQEDLQG